MHKYVAEMLLDLYAGDNNCAAFQKFLSGMLHLQAHWCMMAEQGKSSNTLEKQC